jgi:nicotinamidase-related amidase
MSRLSIRAVPGDVELDDATTALILIDMQRDFLEPGGFGEALGNDVARLRGAIEPCRRLLVAARRAGLLIIHTREGHLPDLSDAPPEKIARGSPSMRIGDQGPMGRILVRGEVGHDIIAELLPRAAEPVVDKSGKGAFYRTELHLLLESRSIRTLLVGGVTTEVCVHSTVREANDRGYRCVVVGDACASYFPEFHDCGLRMIAAQGGIFGWVAQSGDVIGALEKATGAAAGARASYARAQRNGAGSR